MNKELALHRLGQTKQMLLSSTSRNSLILFSGNIATTILSTISVIFISRSLGPENFGLLAIYTSLSTALLGLTDFGLGTTAIKLIAGNLEEDKRYAAVVMRVILFIELASGLLIGLVGLFASSWVAGLLGGQSLLTTVQLAFFASIFASAGAFIGPFLISHERFWLNAALGFFSSFMKLVGVLILFSLAHLHIHEVLLLYVGITVVSFFIGLYFAPREYMVKATRPEERRALGEIFHFSKWILLSYFATVAAGKLDIFLLVRYRGSEAVGLYAAAQQLASIMPLLIGAITTVLLPRVTKMKTTPELIGYVKKVLVGAFLLIVALSPMLFFSDILIKLIFGSKFLGSITSFKVLFAAYLLSLVVNPVSLVLYAVNKPKILTFINYGSLVISTVLNIILIPRYGIIGAAFTFLVGTILAMSVIIPISIREAGRRA